MQLRYNQPDWQPLTRAAIPCKIPSNLHFHTLCRGHFCICRRDFCRRMIRDGCRLGAGRLLFGGFAMVGCCTQQGALWDLCGSCRTEIQLLRSPPRLLVADPARFSLFSTPARLADLPGFHISNNQTCNKCHKLSENLNFSTAASVLRYGVASVPGKGGRPRD